jgi:hypothetical protein
MPMKMWIVVQSGDQRVGTRRRRYKSKILSLVKKIKGPYIIDSIQKCCRQLGIGCSWGISTYVENVISLLWGQIPDMDSSVIVHHEAHEGTVDNKANLDRVSDEDSNDTLRSSWNLVLTKDKQTIPDQRLSVS